MWLILALLCLLFNGLSAFYFKINAIKKGSTVGLLWGFYFAGSIGSGLYAWYNHTHNHTLAWSWSILIAGIIIGLGNAVGNILYSNAVRIGPAGLTAMVSHSHVIFIVLMSLLIYNETLTRLEEVAISLIILGVLFLPFDPNQN